MEMDLRQLPESSLVLDESVLEEAEATSTNRYTVVINTESCS